MQELGGRTTRRTTTYLCQVCWGSQPELNSTINLEEEGGRSQGPVTQAHLSAAMANSMVQNDLVQGMNQTMEAYRKGHSDSAKTLEKVFLILEDTNQKGIKRGNKEEEDTDKVTLLEKTLTSRDDGHKTLDYEV